MRSTLKRAIIGIAIVAAGGGLAFAFNGPIRGLSAGQPPRFQLPAAPQPKETTLFFAGDIMLSREVRGKIMAANDPSLPYRNVADRIRKASVAFAHLESPFSPTNAAPANRLVFQAEPAYVTGLK